MIFLFDFDGTISKVESLPWIARHYSIPGGIERMTKSANQEVSGYKENLINRIAAFSGISVEDAVVAIGRVPLNEGVVGFIRENKERCGVVTSNLDCWVGPLLLSFGCRFFTSRSIVKDNRVVGVEDVLDKKAIVTDFKRNGEEVAYIGDGANDVEAMMAADISIAFLASESSFDALSSICDHSCSDEPSLLHLLERLEKYRLNL